MTEAGLLASFGVGFVIGGIFGAVGVLVYGKQPLNRKKPQPRRWRED